MFLVKLVGDDWGEFLALKLLEEWKFPLGSLCDEKEDSLDVLRIGRSWKYHSFYYRHLFYYLHAYNIA